MKRRDEGKARDILAATLEEVEAVLGRKGPEVVRLNQELLRRGVGLSSTSDSEVITQMLAGGEGRSWDEKLRVFMVRAQGAYCLTVLTSDQLQALTSAQLRGLSAAQPGPRAAHHVHVQVLDFLPPFGTGIAEHPESAVRIRVAALLQGQLGRQHHHAPHQGGVLGAKLRHRRYVLLRNHQKMHGRPRIDVVKDEDLVVLVDHLGRYLPGNDPAEDAIGVDIANLCAHTASPIGKPLFMATMPLTIR